jgi:uncharacterized repeat protein (TIGR01451 family)
MLNFVRLWLALGSLALLLGFAAPARALSSVQVTATLASGTVFVSDSNNCPTDGPGTSYIAYKITNTSGVALNGVTAGLNGVSGLFSFAGGQAASQFLGTLSAGEVRYVYWYVSYPCHDAPGGPHAVSATVTLADNQPGTVTSAPSALTSTSMISANAGGSIASFTLGNNAFVGQILTLDVVYSFGGIANGDQFFIQPAGNTSFDAGCVRLIGSDITASVGFGTSFPATLADGDLHWIADASSPGSKKSVTVQYSFVYECAGVTTTANPFAAQTSGASNLKYTGNFADPLATVGVPAATNPFTISKTVSPATLLPGSTGPVTYTITVTNTSTTLDASLGSISDVLPANVSFGALTGASDFTAAMTATMPANGATGTIQFVSNPIPSASRYFIPAGTSRTLVYTASVSNTAPIGTYTNSATGTTGNSTTSPAATASFDIAENAVIGAAK